MPCWLSKYRCLFEFSGPPRIHQLFFFSIHFLTSKLGEFCRNVGHCEPCELYRDPKVLKNVKRQRKWCTTRWTISSNFYFGKIEAIFSSAKKTRSTPGWPEIPIRVWSLWIFEFFASSKFKYFSMKFEFLCASYMPYPLVTYFFPLPFSLTLSSKVGVEYKKSFYAFFHSEDRPLPKMKLWMQQICSAISYIHSMQLIHRDLKVCFQFIP